MSMPTEYTILYIFLELRYRLNHYPLIAKKYKRERLVRCEILVVNVKKMAKYTEIRVCTIFVNSFVYLN